LSRMEAAMKVPDDFGVAESDLTELVTAHDLHSVRRSEDCILGELDRCNYDEQAVFAIKLALEEALTNAVKHGNANDKSKKLVVRFCVKRDRAVLMVRDQGGGFNPENLPDPTADENLEMPNGRGIMLMSAYMTKVCFNDVGNEVWMLKENRP